MCSSDLEANANACAYKSVSAESVGARAWAAECAASITTICVRERDRSDSDGGCACVNGVCCTRVGIWELNCHESGGGSFCLGGGERKSRNRLCARPRLLRERQWVQPCVLL